MPAAVLGHISLQIAFMKGPAWPGSLACSKGWSRSVPSFDLHQSPQFNMQSSIMSSSIASR